MHRLCEHYYYAIIEVAHITLYVLKESALAFSGMHFYPMPHARHVITQLLFNDTTIRGYCGCITIGFVEPTNRRKISRVVGI